ncbi:hypothetical protein QUB05_24540 [Microcoleus sp. F10-C6]|uniref:hypothetical protein n=1 Tax=unclassified Microcoleus TaxID=2642155 RepID=UPI002FD58963
MKDEFFFEEFAFLLVKYQATNKANKYRGVPLSSICWTLRGLLNMRTEGVNLTSDELLFLKEWGWIMELSPSNPLYKILKKVDSGQQLSKQERMALEREQQEVKLIWKREQQREQQQQREREQQEKKLVLAREQQEKKLALAREQQEKKLALASEQQEKINKERHLAELATKYRVSSSYSSISNRLYDLLCQIDRGNQLSDSEVIWMKVNRFYEPIEISRKMQHFAGLKFMYKATKNQDSLPSSNLYKILKRIENNQPLSPKDGEWLKQQELSETFAIFEERKVLQQTVFSHLKNKYQATKHPDSSVSSPLYQILKKLDTDKQLSLSDINWLEEHQLSETLGIVVEIENNRHFAELKIKYKASQYEDSSLSSHLYKVLKKIDSASQLGEQDINFLKKRKLTETITVAIDKYAASLKSKIKSGEQLSEADIDWAKQNGREDVITFPQEREFAALKSKYDVSNYKDKSPSSPLYAILQKLDKGDRIEEIDVAWLEENKLEAPQPSYSYYGWQEERRYQGQKLFSGKIWTAYHKNEATFYEQEYQRTGNKWNLPNASSHWRKADKPRSALKLTENLDFNQIKENKLKSALLTTRGGAFRDIDKLDDAQKCALKAIEYQPQSHHPYTLMGAICFERGQFLEGERWFNEAIKRGASPRDQDAEMKRVVKNAKDENKRREVINYLLEKDSRRYAWANSYLKQSKNKAK